LTPARGSRADLDAALSGTSVVDLTGWRAIDSEERRRGTAAGRSRSKILDVAEMVAVAEASKRVGGSGRPGRVLFSRV
jgi:ferredoxin--NADP+ reductase